MREFVSIALQTMNHSTDCLQRRILTDFQKRTLFSFATFSYPKHLTALKFYGFVAIASLTLLVTYLVTH